MSQKTKVALIIVAGMVLFVAAVAGWYWRWLSQQRPALLQQRAAGLAFGKQTDDAACWQEALRRHKAAKDFAGAVQNNSFLLACLAAASNPPNFCEGVPFPGEIVTGARWTLERCGRPEMQGISQADCKGLLATLQTYCSEYYKR